MKIPDIVSLDVAIEVLLNEHAAAEKTMKAVPSFRDFDRHELLRRKVIRLGEVIQFLRDAGAARGGS